MDKFEIREVFDKKIWEDFVLKAKPKSFLQSWNWGETHKLLGEKIFRLGVYKNGVLVGICLAIYQAAKRGKHLVVPGGPLVDFNDRKLLTYLIEELKRLSKRQKASFIRVRPELLESKESRNLFGSLGFLPAPMHLHAENTWILNIKGSEEEILAGMRKTTRYLVRKSLKSGLDLEITKDSEKCGILARLQEDTVKRHKFVGFSKKLFESQLTTFGNDNQAALFIVRKGNISLAAAIVIFYGDYAYYHHSGSTLSHPEIPASYFLQWQIILEAKRRGISHYNFWGVAPTDNPKHRFYGVTLFKKGFGGEQIDWLHAHDLPTSRLYWLTYAFETLRKRSRGL